MNIEFGGKCVCMIQYSSTEAAHWLSQKGDMNISIFVRGRVNIIRWVWSVPLRLLREIVWNQCCVWHCSSLSDYSFVPYSNQIHLFSDSIRVEESVFSLIYSFTTPTNYFTLLSSLCSLKEEQSSEKFDWGKFKFIWGLIETLFLCIKLDSLAMCLLRTFTKPFHSSDFIYSLLQLVKSN